MSDLPGGNWDAGRLPEAVKSVAAQALRTAEGRDAPGEVALARVLSHSGTWVVLHGATMVSEGPQRVAVIVEPAHPARIVPLLMAAYGLTEREQEVTRLVLQGDSTAQIAEQLVVSPHTVQEHLKHIFEKTGVSSRRDLTGKVFFSHYEPRLRDNERRTVARQAAARRPRGLIDGLASREEATSGYRFRYAPALSSAAQKGSRCCGRAGDCCGRAGSVLPGACPAPPSRALP